MTPEQIEQLISRRRDPDFTPAEQAQLDRLLRDNPHARRLSAQYDKLDHALDHWSRQTPSADYDTFARNVSAALDAVPRPHRRAVFTWRTLWAPLSAAAVITLALTIWLNRSTPTTDIPQPSSPLAFVHVQPDTPPSTTPAPSVQVSVQIAMDDEPPSSTSPDSPDEITTGTVVWVAAGPRPSRQPHQTARNITEEELFLMF